MITGLTIIIIYEGCTKVLSFSLPIRVAGEAVFFLPNRPSNKISSSVFYLKYSLLFIYTHTPIFLDPCIVVYPYILFRFYLLYEIVFVRI